MVGHGCGGITVLQRGWIPFDAGGIKGECGVPALFGLQKGIRFGEPLMLQGLRQTKKVSRDRI